jgi:TRAP-type C4-dicarboxylate transport system permease large subunit
VAASIGNLSIGSIAKAGLPFLLVCLLVLLLVTYIPQLSLYLPSLFYD